MPKLKTKPAPRCLKCPSCGTTDLDDLAVRETFSAFHPIRTVVTAETDEEGTLKPGALGVIVENALGTDCPSVHFDDGDDDYRGYCKACGHTADLEDFGIDAIKDWS